MQNAAHAELVAELRDQIAILRSDLERERSDRNAERERFVARQSKPLIQRQSGIHPMVEKRSVGKLVSSPKPPEAGAQRARPYTSLTAGHHNSRMQLTLDDAHSRQ